MKMTNILLFIALMCSFGYIVHLDEKHSEIPEIKKYTSQLDTLTVDATIYYPDPLQTDSTPLFTSTGFKVDSLNPIKNRVLAVSQDLLESGWIKYGDTILVTGVGNLSGKWIVRDCMNKRHTRMVDMLVNPGTKCWGVWKNILIFNTSKHESKS